MTPRKRKTKLVLKKFLRENKNILKELAKKSPEAKPYTREPWMMRINPTEDKYEEFLRKEAESLQKKNPAEEIYNSLTIY